MTRALLLLSCWLCATAASSEAVTTSYCPCEICCPGTADGKTSTMTDAWKRGIAVDPRRIPYGSLLYVPGYGFALADDTGAAMRNARGLHVDVRFKTHRQARAWGARLLTIVWVP